MHRERGSGVWMRDEQNNVLENSVESKARRTINLVLFTRYSLTGQCIKMIVEKHSGIQIGSIATSEKELLKIVKKTKPDVVLFCLLENESDKFEIMPQVIELSPNSKGMILSPLDGTFDQTQALKLGATGIVGASQRDEVLVRAIRQVAEGEVWLNQQLIARLVGNYSNGHANDGNNEREAQLTGRELEVIEAIACGLNNKDISRRLLISEATVRHHLSSIYSKLYVEDRLNLVIYAFQHNIVGNPLDKDL